MKNILVRSFAILLTFILLFSCKNKEELKIMTVTGEFPACKIGVTLTHEHILVDFIGADSINPNRYIKDSVIAKAAPYLEELKKFKVATFIECTPEFLGRDPQLLVELSRKTSIKFLTNTGWYAANGGKHLPQKVNEMTSDGIAKLWINEAKNGIGNSGVKPGFIKIGIYNMNLSETDRKLIEAAALTHLSTGLTIMSHTGYAEGAFAQLKILEQKNVDPSAFIWTHALAEPKNENILDAARRGTWVAFDGITDNYDAIGSVIQLLKFIKEAGKLDRVLLSHDAGWYRPGEKGGGKFRGFTDLFVTLIPRLKQEGFTNKELELLTVKNPAEAFAVRVRPLTGI